ncbi:hypothetical protein EVAR_99587_1 [Eumeta japonica]|uniref:Uncharacterized protein n=1 Tax=Eumeta variegata TaxID=151549 RepID=A0A4C1ZJL2_EUMVA|nr:hypothetical protein EVAR_99587_1 [Eumeta japonica]
MDVAKLYESLVDYGTLKIAGTVSVAILIKDESTDGFRIQNQSNASLRASVNFKPPVADVATAPVTTVVTTLHPRGRGWRKVRALRLEIIFIGLIEDSMIIVTHGHPQPLRYVIDINVKLSGCNNYLLDSSFPRCLVLKANEGAFAFIATLRHQTSSPLRRPRRRPLKRYTQRDAYVFFFYAKQKPGYTNSFMPIDNTAGDALQRVGNAIR